MGQNPKHPPTPVGNHNEAKIFSLITPSGESLIIGSPFRSIPSSRKMENPSIRQSLGSILTLYQKIASTEDISVVDDMSSPPYSPTPSVMERPTLSSRVESQLRRACAIIVEETNPSTHEFDHLPDHNETNRKYAEIYHTYKNANQVRPSKPDARPSTSRQVRGGDTEPIVQSATYIHIPKNAATSFEATAGLRKSSSTRNPEGVAAESLEPSHPAVLVDLKNGHSQSDEQIVKLRAVIHARPKTSAAACIDYSGPSVDTSSSTTRTNTTYDGFVRSNSTGLTSLASPLIEKKSSPTSQRVSEQILQDGPAASLADATAKAWMAQELSRRRIESGSGRNARPSTRASSQPKWSDTDRPVSRAGSLAGSVKMGLRDYIRPRASMDSVRSTRSESGLYRNNSRGGKENRGSGSNWWQGSSSKNKRSWSSFRSARPDGAGDHHSAGKDGEPNLNRALPALPGLDQYKERKPMPTHIAQLMRPGRTDGGKAMQETVPDSYQQFLAEAELKAWQEKKKKAMEERMMHDAMMASANFGVHSDLREEAKRSQSVPNAATMSLPCTNVSAVPKPSMQTKKTGLRKRFSRFWSHGGERGVDGGSKAYANMVIAN